MGRGGGGGGEEEEEKKKKKKKMMMMMMIGFSATVPNTLLGDTCQLALHYHSAGHFFIFNDLLQRKYVQYVQGQVTKLLP